jgi:serine/threonine protein kinase
MLRMPNEKIANGVDKDIDNMIKNSKNVFNSPTRFFKVKHSSSLEFNLEDNLIKMEEFSLGDGNSEIQYENWIYKLSESMKIKKYWLVLIGKDIYYYKNDKKDELLGMHNLSGCFIKENGEKKIGEEKMHSFAVIFTGKTRNYYCYDKEAALKWATSIKNAIGYSSFFDFYEMLDDLGEGKFGLVKMGVHKKTKEKVAIKIIKKESMQNSADIELVKSEIDIMKLCRHPNIVRLLDHFENAEYIFIVMEFLQGGDLGDYLNKNKFSVSEARAASIMFQIASGIYYLHQYGVLHRDLKPENIMLTENSEKGVIKIMDFGLSKIMGPDERVADGFGTLSFVAPEVLIRQPYGKQIDIWSLGVILYYMLSGTLPFDDENDNEEVIAKMTVFVEVQFPSKSWAKKTPEVIDIISKCLIKDPNKRITIEEYLQHPWIAKHLSDS